MRRESRHKEEGHEAQGEAHEDEGPVQARSAERRQDEGGAGAQVAGVDAVVLHLSAFVTRTENQLQLSRLLLHQRKHTENKHASKEGN